jgi:hypothetical protein
MSRSLSTARVPQKSSGAWQPRVVFWLLSAVILILASVEVLNLFRGPSLVRMIAPERRASVVVYQRGRSHAREAWLLIEPKGDLGPAQALLRVDCSPKDTFTGDLVWSRDGALLAGLQRRSHGGPPTDVVIWVYDFAQQKLWTADPAHVGATTPHLRATQTAMRDFLGRHGGRGPLAISWYELGKKGNTLFAWQITRWESALPAAS